MNALPAWSQTDEARALLDAIRHERPEYRVRLGLWIEGGGVKRYRGANAAKLRAYHAALLDEALNADDADFADAGKQGGRFHEINAVKPDELIERVLSEVPYTRVEFTDLGGGKHRVAA